MRSWILSLLFCAGLSTAAPSDGFRPLFNGRDLDGWFGWGTDNPAKLLAMTPEQLKATMEKSMEDIRKHWSVENGELVNDGHGLYLSTREFFGDFELALEYKTVPRADSGIYLRGCPQVQIWDSTEKEKFNLGADKGSGGLWNNSAGAPGKDPTALMDKPFGEWNKMRVRLVGERVSVWLNGTLVVDNARMENYFDRKGPLPARGPIQLQTHGGEIRWREVQVREIPAEEANRILNEASGNEGWKSLFDGKSLEGWQGAVQGWEVTPEGWLACKKGSGGSLLTQEEYADFIFQFEFKLPAGGNNGVAARAPLQGDPAWDGFEIQVLDDRAPQYANLKPYQFHGSVYGLVPAQRGYLRPLEEWNHQEVRFEGSKVKVTVNGTVVVDADLSRLDRSKIERIPKGLDREKGFLGFAGHNDPVVFRHIRVKKLGTP